MKKLFLAGSICLLILGQNAIASNVSVGWDLSQATQTEKPPEPNTQLQVTILDLGAEPRQQLGFTPVIGSRQTIKMRFTMGMQMTVDNEPLLNNVRLTMETTIDTTVKKIEPNGDIHFNFVYSKADMITESAAVRSSMPELVGLGASIVVDPQGNLKKTYDFVFPEKMSLEIRETMMKQFLDSYSQIYSPLPTEAVGKGARWQVTQAVPMTYVENSVNQNIVYELVDRQDNILTLVSTLKQQAQSQNSIPLDGSSEISVQIISVDSLGDGKITMDLGQMMPLDSTASIKSNMVMKTQSPELAKAMLANMTMVINLTIQSQ